MRLGIETVIDASPLIYLARTRAIDVARHLMGPMKITTGVEREVIVVGSQRGHEDARLLSRARDEGALEVVELTPDEREASLALAGEGPLGSGERETMAVAEVRGWRAMLEDRKARRVAGARGIETISTIDVIILAVLAGNMDASTASDSLRKLARLTQMSAATLFEQEFVVERIAARVRKKGDHDG